MSRIDQIVDLIIREALNRTGRFPSKVKEVNIEVMLKIIEIMDNHMEGERKKECNT